MRRTEDYKTRLKKYHNISFVNHREHFHACKVALFRLKLNVLRTDDGFSMK